MRDLNSQSQETRRSPNAASVSKASEKAQILIVCDDRSITKRLRIAFQAASLSSEVVHSMTAGCAFARSGRFHVVFTVPALRDGSWRRLTDIANQYDLGFVVVLVASGYDFNQCAEAVKGGAFDVLDPMHELPKTAEAARCALWAAYLKGVGPCPEVVSHPLAA
jgi:DNA-binding NtrC family response regulator